MQAKTKAPFFPLPGLRGRAEVFRESFMKKIKGDPEARSPKSLSSWVLPRLQGVRVGGIGAAGRGGESWSPTLGTEAALAAAVTLTAGAGALVRAVGAVLPAVAVPALRDAPWAWPLYPGHRPVMPQALPSAFPTAGSPDVPQLQRFAVLLVFQELSRTQEFSLNPQFSGDFQAPQTRPLHLCLQEAGPVPQYLPRRPPSEMLLHRSLPGLHTTGFPALFLFLTQTGKSRRPHQGWCWPG